MNQWIYYSFRSFVSSNKNIGQVLEKNNYEIHRSLVKIIHENINKLTEGMYRNNEF